GWMSTDVQQATNSETLTNEEGKAVIDSWLNQRLRITIPDSRSFEGWFKCVDRECNVVLSGTEEFRDGAPPPQAHLCRPTTFHRPDSNPWKTSPKSRTHPPCAPSRVYITHV